MTLVEKSAQQVPQNDGVAGNPRPDDPTQVWIAAGSLNSRLLGPRIAQPPADQRIASRGVVYEPECRLSA